MSELAGSLIEMNAHMYPGKMGVLLMCIGLVLVFISIFVFAVLFERVKKSLLLMIVLPLMLILGVSCTFYGNSLPKQKIIMACANGPISIERISAAYDVLEIDGKMLKLKVR